MVRARHVRSGGLRSQQQELQCHQKCQQPKASQSLMLAHPYGCLCINPHQNYSSLAGRLAAAWCPGSTACLAPCHTRHFLVTADSPSVTAGFNHASMQVVVNRPHTTMTAVTACGWTLMPASEDAYLKSAGSSVQTTPSRHIQGLALMMAAPRCCTVSMNSPCRYLSSPMASLMGLPAAVPCVTSGYCVLEWLPQMMTFLTSVTGMPVFRATCSLQVGKTCSGVTCGQSASLAQGQQQR